MFAADLVTFTEEILDGKLQFLCSGKLETPYFIWLRRIHFLVCNYVYFRDRFRISFLFKLINLKNSHRRYSGKKVFLKVS